MAYYMANARECFDRGFHLLYGNPYAGYETPRIYFQPQTLLLGCLVRAGLDPGVAFDLFGLATIVFATVVAIRFYREVTGLETTAKKIGLVCFFWGGGALTLAGIVHAVAAGHLHRLDLWNFDPAYGWWMLNFGRNLVYPTEAYYHGLFLLTLLFLVRRKTAPALVCSLLLSLSHPFSGLSLALILVAYSAWELILGSGAVRPAMLVGAIAIVVAHFAYYRVFPDRFVDHRNLRDQWALPWLYEPRTYLPALLIVGTLAALRVWRWPGLRAVLKDSRNRLFLVWFAVVFALSQHNLLMKPFQPIHFAHGYDWMALFFLSAPLLIAILDRLLAISSARLRLCALGSLLLLFLFDNATWLGTFLSSREDPPTPLALTHSEWAVLEWLDENAVQGSMVVCDDPLVSYLVSTYTPIRSWAGHMPNTPSFDQRQKEVTEAFRDGHILQKWEAMPTYYVPMRVDDWHPPANVTGLYHNEEFTIFGPPANRAP